MDIATSDKPKGADMTIEIIFLNELVYSSGLEKRFRGAQLIVDNFLPTPSEEDEAQASIAQEAAASMLSSRRFRGF